MDKEIIYIQNILSKTNIPLTAGGISKKIFEEYNHKISKKIVTNYLWSYFRDDIEYNTENYTYKFLKHAPIDIESFELIPLKDAVRVIDLQVKGTKLVVQYDSSLSLEKLIMIISHLNLERVNSKHDLVKKINQYNDKLI